MRIRRLSTVFWGTCIFVFVFILYVVTDLTFKLPSIRPVAPQVDDKWSLFESKLNQLENELSQHHAVVGEIKDAVSKISYNPPQPLRREQKSFEEENAVIKEPPRQVVKEVHSGERKKPGKLPKPRMLQCPIKKEDLPKTDVQMLTMYERISFEDVDGGVWKQGWAIEYDEKQWSSANRLKVFVVPHSHNDPGWLKTFENYYKTQTRAIFTNMVEKLNEVPGRKFIWCEVSFLSLWWTTDATDKEKAAFLKLLNSGNIEIVTGGWVMNDEANAHWLSIIQQLTTGHQWLLENMQYTPKNHWSIDPFGYSSSQPYLLKLAGLENSVIQRVHYRIKKELAMNRELEFKWRQLWDGVGSTDMFTHMMPFYSYDVPHTCGPDPKVCCQFDFKHLSSKRTACPWGVRPRNITHKNIAERAFLILDQWRKKAQLYRSNVVLIPLGDDFRYDRANEWDNQYRSYEALRDYINTNTEWNADVQFGTLEDYFKAVHSEVKSSEFPVLSGDFFTYADRNKHYWSGYYTSRPFYKSMDRVLLAYVRAADIITMQAVTCGAVTQVRAVTLRDRCEHARRALSLFQHHDGVTGTSRDDVREDYARKMLQAIKYSQSAIQQAAYHLLGEPRVREQTQEDVYLDVDDIWRRHDEIPARITIALDVVSPSRKIVLYNALTFARTDVTTVIVNTPHVEVFDPSGSPMMAQISPMVTSERRLGFAPNKYELSFPATVQPLAMAVYTVALRDNMTINKYTSYSRVRIYNSDFWTVDLPKMFPVDSPTAKLEDDVTLSAGNGTRVVCTKTGLVKAVTLPGGGNFPLAMDFVQVVCTKTGLVKAVTLPGGGNFPLAMDFVQVVCTKTGLVKAVTLPGGGNFPLAMDFVQVVCTKTGLVKAVTLPGGGNFPLAMDFVQFVCTKTGLVKAVTLPGGGNFPLAMDFVQYDTVKEPDNNSGAYLFIPSGPAEPVRLDAYPDIIITEGMYKASLHTSLGASRTVELALTVSVYNNPSLPQAEVYVSNTLLIDPSVDDIELAMRLATRVHNGDTFYTDLNGMQMIKRRYFEKLPLQANFYPLPAAAYIQDDTHRLNVLTSTPLGMAALQPGEIQVMQDRRLSRDDNRGLNQGVMDNVRTRHNFKLIIETANKPCQKPPHPSHPSGQLSLGAHISAQTLLHPLTVMQYSAGRDSAPDTSRVRSPRSAADLVLADARSHTHAKTASGKSMQGVGLTFQRVYLDPCYGSRDIYDTYPVSDGQIELREYVDVSPSQVFPSTLTFTQVRRPAAQTVLSVCPMEVVSVFLNYSMPRTNS
ncbi:hypothetical protein O0L34_g768 [Tuta absoluta]|nr:hypothetical protein O0L34_g768 [Tuta absoluta]